MESGLLESNAYRWDVYELNCDVSPPRLLRHGGEGPPGPGEGHGFGLRVAQKSGRLRRGRGPEKIAENRSAGVGGEMSLHSRGWTGSPFHSKLARAPLPISSLVEAHEQNPRAGQTPAPSQRGSKWPTK